ncbi:DEHA2G09614p [Debaryomyces hansenii CBS767]|uniref:DEHA2G09614p n=1 Tax=Debaryomyces hansenii (strain ATCC 36239 / CBS 767 / BCRC 21394 / JCM 1990 / NBRC 0083 / IGC 2968) TaxID=284592 RepID=Q6BIK7_DEBHA|nr:DEHA2G09614p [Debaryomyces hansenii CBS767]CAG90432.2 DEHA2G09614p [Debaryomyces hansenii CBS767]|eukprot:XP_461964.2 DEHA2G09614p [Debaryomyces hansenii CBS767]
MALPLETTHLIAQLRVSYLTLTDNDEYARRIIKPLAVGGNETKQQQNIYTRLEMPESPPITFNANHHIQDTISNTGSEVRKRTIKKRKKTDRNKNKREAKNAHKRDDRMNVESIEEEEAPDLPVRPQRSVDTSDANESTGEVVGLSYTKSIKGINRKSKPNIVKFFHSSKNNDSDSDSDSDDTSRAPAFVASERNLELIEEEKANEDEVEDNARDRNKVYEKDTSDAITIDSDFEVPVAASGDVLKSSATDFGYDDQDDSLRSRSNTIDTVIIDEDEDEDVDVEEGSNFTEDEDEYEDEDEDDDEDADVSSTDSAFTDIETDSILDSSMLLGSYNDNAYNSYSFGTQNDTLPSFRSNYKKLKKKKSRLNSFDSQSLSKNTGNIKRSTSQTLLNSDPNGEQINSMINSKALPNSSVSYNSNRLANSRKNSFTFGKVDVSKQNENINQPRNSKLSMLIQSRYKSSNINPLNYYTFASSYIDSIHKASLNIYVPPSNSPVITNLNINDNVAVSDCIGYILLKLSTMSEFSNKDDSSLMNPNRWRLELVDEDGENYGSFGILDRTRLLSSYNNPRDIALCEITDEAEIIKNEKQAPLPMEFRQNLLAHEKKQASSSVNSKRNSLLVNGKDETIELKILRNFNDTLQTSDYSLIFISARASMGQVLDEFCAENELDSSRYELREILLREVPGHNHITHKHLQPENTLLQGNLRTDMGPTVFERKGILKSTDSVLELESNTLELVPSDVMQSMVAQEYVNDHSLANMAITPSESTNTLPLITPPAKQMEDKFQTLNIANEMKSNASIRTRKDPRRNTTESIRRTINSNKYLDDIIRGKNPLLPTNINTIYFTWKVWRKKPTILNKIEKTLIIDGDYIHLTPSDVMVWKKNPSENPFLSNQQNHSQSHHYHHYLHHYNYSNYYNTSMMKTSSFHITQITKLKQYKNSKNPNHFKIVIKKHVDGSTNAKDSSIKKKYDLEAANVDECEEIIKKIKWVLQVYSMSNLNST